MNGKNHCVKQLMKLWWIRNVFSLKFSSDGCGEIVPALHGTACPRFPGSASCSPQPAADGSSTKGAGILRVSEVNIGTAIPMRSLVWLTAHVFWPLSPCWALSGTAASSSAFETGPSWWSGRNTGLSQKGKQNRGQTLPQDTSQIQ